MSQRLTLEDQSFTGCVSVGRLYSRSCCFLVFCYKSFNCMYILKKKQVDIISGFGHHVTVSRIHVLITGFGHQVTVSRIHVLITGFGHLVSVSRIPVLITGFGHLVSVSRIHVLITGFGHHVTVSRIPVLINCWLWASGHCI